MKVSWKSEESKIYLTVDVSKFGPSQVLFHPIIFDYDSNYNAFSLRRNTFTQHFAG